MNCLELKEKTNKNTINKLLISEHLNAYEKRMLTRYKKKIVNNEVDVIYRYGNGCDSGRIFAKESLSLQMFRKEIRHTLARDIYKDIDIRNAHPELLKQLCDKNGWKCDRLTEYIENRENILKDICNKFSINRDDAKTSVLAIINGGGYKSGYQFINDFAKELKIIRENVYNTEPKYVKLAEKKEKKEKNDNIHGSVINMKLCEIENTVLMSMKKFFDNNNLTVGVVGVLVFDGIMVENNDSINEELLNKCCEFVEDETKYKIKLVIKPMDLGYDLKSFDDLDYEIMKKNFEKDTFKIGTSELFIRYVNGNPTFIKPSLLLHRYGNMKCTVNGEFKKFIRAWLDDENIKLYENIDFVPTPLICSDDTFNLFDGLEAETIIFKEDTNIDLVLNHCYKLTGNDDKSFDFFIKFLAHMVQKPGELIGIALVFKSNEGAGKNLFFNFYGDKILGSKYFSYTADPTQLFGRFAQGRKNKILINLDETSGADTFKYSELIKSFITAPVLQYEQKGIDPVNISNYARWIFTSNNETPIKISLNDRRFVVFGCDNSICKDKEYFDKLVEAFNDENVSGKFYDYLMNIDIDGYDFINNRPITEEYKDIQSVNIPILVRFLDEYKYLFDFYSENYIETVVLFKYYIKYLEDCNIKKDGSTLNKFSRELNKMEDSGIKYFRKKNSKGYNINRIELDNYLLKFLA